MSAKVFSVPIADRWLLQAPLHGLSALVNQSALACLAGSVSDLPAEVRSLRDGLLVEVETPQPLSGDIAPDFLGFITTRACNIGCVYCDFSGPSAKKVDIDPLVVVSAIDWMAQRLVSTGRRRFHVHLFGGEPTHAPEMVDLIVHRTRAVCAATGLIPWFEVTTNGVFDDGRAEFLGDYADAVVLSLDGPRDIHDRHRPGFGGRPMFDVVQRAARRLAELPVQLCLRVCVTRDSAARLEEITRWMCREFRPAIINHEPLTENAVTRRAGLRPPDPYQFARHWMHSYRTARNHGVKVVYAAVGTESPRLSSCPVGKDALIVSPDGRASACYLMPEEWQRRGMNMDLGWVHDDGRVAIDRKALDNVRNLVVDKPRCEKCFCQWECAGGCHVSHSYRNCDTTYNAFCFQTRVLSACLILERLGAADLVDQLLDDRTAMARLATRSSDCLCLETTCHGDRETGPGRAQVPASI